MAYIIAHGTVDGYRKITQVPPIGTEQSVLTDIRAEFDNTLTMLNKPCGYLIQMAEKGVWMSVVKLLFDGERSGNGSGFFAFSAFLPQNQVISGLFIKQTLDNLLSQYLTRIGDDFTKNIGIDWSFVEHATADLNANCQLRSKVANTNFKEESQEKKKGFAYIDIHSDADIEQYLDKPFQPEYGEYRAVFLGTHLQNPNHFAEQKPLAIDFDNEEYEIIWEGSRENYPNMHLPQSIRKKEIPTKTLDFQRQCYKLQTVKFAEGTRDNANAILTLTIPKLDPVEYVVKFSISRPDQVVSITASQPYKPSRQSEDKQTLKFYGEEALSNWHVVIKTNPKFEDVERDIYPFDDATIQNGIGITLQELQTVSLQILLDGTERTITEKGKIQIYNKKLNKQESQDKLFNKAHNCIEILIPINKTIEELYDISLFNQHKQKYECQLHSVSETFYQIILTTRKERTLVPPSNDRTIKVVIPNRFLNHQIFVSDGNSKWNINASQQKTYEDYGIYSITCDRHTSRDTFSFTINEKPVITKNEGDDTIRIIGIKSIPNVILNWLRKYSQYIKVGVLGFLFLLFLTAATLCILNWFRVIDIKNWFAHNNDAKVETTTDANTSTSTASFVPTYSKEYLELDSVYQIQQKQWNLQQCKSSCTKYEEKQITLKENDSIAFVRLKQLSWLWRTREKLETRDWNHLAQFIKEGDSDFETKWKTYATSELLAFLRDVVKTSNNQKTANFAEKIKNDKSISTKSFEDIKGVWDNCHNQSSSSTRGRTQRTNNSNNSNNNSQQQDNSQRMKGADEY